jgi:hypothetical protein
VFLADGVEVTRVVRPWGTDELAEAREQQVAALSL